MSLSIFTTMTNPQKRGDTSREALRCYKELANEIVIVDGSAIGHTQHSGNVKVVRRVWEQQFDWPFIGQQFQRGYDACSGDWVIHMDLDFLFHQKDFGRIHQALKDYPNSPAISFYKWQFIIPDRYNLKSRLLIAVNKKQFGSRITFSGSGDLCQPQLDGKDLDLSEMPQAGVPFYNYEKLTKTKEQVTDDVERMDNAYLKHFGQTLYSNDELTAYEGWLRMMIGRFNKPSAKIGLTDHPKYIQETIKNLRPEQFGYDGFGNLPKNSYV